jgi:hypothetical protein
MAEFRAPLGAMPNGVASVGPLFVASGCRVRRIFALRPHSAPFASRLADAPPSLCAPQPRSYATPTKSVAAGAPRALDFASPFSPNACPADEARLLSALTTRLKKRVDDVERTGAKCAPIAAETHTQRCADAAPMHWPLRTGWERDACRTAAKKELDDLCEAVNTALADAPQQARRSVASPRSALRSLCAACFVGAHHPRIASAQGAGGPNAALRAELLRSFDALVGVVAAVPSVVAPVQRSLAEWAGAALSGVAYTFAQQPQRKPLPPLPAPLPAASPTRPAVTASGKAAAAAIEAAAAADVTAEMTPQRRVAATPDAGGMLSPAWWARPEPKVAEAAAPEAAPPAEEERADDAPQSAEKPMHAAAGGCCVVS